MQDFMISLGLPYSFYFNIFDILLFSAFSVNNWERCMEVYFDSVFFLRLGVGSIHFYFMYFEAILLE